MANLSNINNKFLVTTGGNVGIGTTSPTNIIHTSTTSNAVGRFESTDATAYIRINDTADSFYLVTGTQKGSIGGNADVNANNLNIDLTNGNVGIGTTSPSHKLNVVAPNNTTAVGIDFPSANFDFSANSTSGYTTKFHMDNTGTYIGSNSAGRALIFQTNDTDRLYINGNTGNVGIGTDSPGRKLDVRTDDGVLIRGASGSVNAKLSFLPASGGRQWDFQNNSSNFQIKDESAGITRMFFHYNGRLAIGSDLTDPLGQVDIYRAAGLSGTAAIAITNGESNGKNWGISTEVVGGGDFALLQSASTGGTPTPTATNVRFIINNSGNVGIGTTNPTSISANTFSLSVGSARNDLSGAVVYQANGTIKSQMYWDSSGLQTVVNSGDARWYTGGVNDRLRITSGGDVLIGTTSARGKLTINSSATSGFSNALGIYAASDGGTYSFANFLLYGTSTVVGSITSNGTSTAYNTSSDYRLKKDLKDFVGLDMVSKIPVYDFKWKTDESRSYGVMAHELQEVLPDAVSGEKDAEEMQGVDYSKIVPLLVKSIQELKAEIDELKK